MAHGTSRTAAAFITALVYPSAASSDGCWDVHPQSVLTHNGGGAVQGIVSMVKYVQQRSSFAGVPFGCFAGSASWNTDCAEGRVDKTAQQWGDLVRGAYPDYGGPRPRVQLWHGTEDDVLRFANFGEATEQWTNVHRVSTAPTSTEYNTPRGTWTRTRYGAQVEAIRALGRSANVPVIDLPAKSRALVESMGPSASQRLYLTREAGDNTHFSAQGATEIANLVVQGVRELNLLLAGHLR